MVKYKKFFCLTETIYRVARKCINTKAYTISDVLAFFIKLVACALQRQLQVFINWLRELFLLAKLHI